MIFTIYLSIIDTKISYPISLGGITLYTLNKKVKDKLKKLSKHCFKFVKYKNYLKLLGIKKNKYISDLMSTKKLDA